MTSFVEVGKNKYKVFIELGYDEITGKRIRRTKTITATGPRILEKKIKEFELKVLSSSPSLSLDNITVHQFYLRWIDNYVRPDLSVRSLETYKNSMKTFLEDYSNMKLSKVKTLHIVEFFKNEKEKGRKNLKGKYLALSSMFTRAVKWGIIKSEANPMKEIDEPKTEKRNRKVTFYSPDQLKDVLTKIDDIYPKSKVQFKLAALAGLRTSEIMGLRHESFDFTNNTIKIDKVLHWNTETKSFTMGPPKNKKTRIVKVPETFMKEIKAFAASHKKQKFKCGPLWYEFVFKGNVENLIFTHPDGKPQHPRSLANQWAKVVNRKNLTYLNFHGLRHTYATFLILKGVNFKVVQEQLGHSSIQETLDTYSHLIEEQRDSAAQLFEELM